MIKNGLKNYFKNLMCVFVPMGCIYLFLITAVVFLVVYCVQDITTAVNMIIALAKNNLETAQENITFQAIFEYFSAQLDFSDGITSVINQVTNAEWIKTTILGFFDSIGISVESIEADFNDTVSDLVASIVTRVLVAFLLIVVGVFLSNFATGAVLRHRTAKRTLKQKIADFVISPIFNTAFVVCFAWVGSYTGDWLSLVLLAELIVYVGMLLATSWFVYRTPQITLKEVVNAKNLLGFLASYILVFVIDIVFLLILYLIMSVLLPSADVAAVFAMLVAVPLFIYSLKIVSLNADSFVYNLSLGTIAPAE